MIKIRDVMEDHANKMYRKLKNVNGIYMQKDIKRITYSKSAIRFW